MTTKTENAAGSVNVFCARCATVLQPGTGSFYVIQIEAFADPTGPTVSTDESPADLRRRIEGLIAQMRDLTAREAMDQVYRRLTLHLCNACYQTWIENPAG